MRDWIARPTAPALLLCGVLLAGVPGGQASAQAGKSSPAALLPGASSHDPVNIEAGRLDYFDKEQKLVYAGNVVARQGETTLRGSMLTIFLSRDAAKGGGEGTSPGGLAGAQANNSVRRMEITGPVTIVSKDEVGTGDNGSYDKAANRMTLSGHVTLTQGANIIKGAELVYDLSSGQAHFTSHPGERIMSVFTPGSQNPADAGRNRGKSGKTAKAAKPAPTSQAEQ